MRSEKEVYDIVLNFAKTDKRIRMVTLEGSRTNTNIPPDDFQDFDITFFVTDMDSFTSDDKWLDIFGERLILQKPEDMELFPAVEKGFSYLMLFTDDVKICPLIIWIPIPICGNPLNNVWHCSGRFRQKWHASWITSIHYMMKKSVIM